MSSNSIMDELEAINNSLKYKQHIELELKTVYGNPLWYPACETSKAYCQAQGIKSYTQRDIKIAKIYGFAVWHVAVLSDRSVKIEEL